MAKDVKTDDYYPFRWKVADTFEDIFVLHRAKAVGALAFLVLGFILLGFVLLDWGSGDSTTSTAGPSTSSTTVAPTTSTISTTSTTVASTMSTISTTSTTVAPTTTVPVSSRGPASAEQLANTESGAVAELSPTTVQVVGGLATDDLADEVVEVVSSIYGDLIVEDLQVVDESFATTTDITFRLSAPDLFAYNRDDLNPTYLPLIDQLAAAAVEAGSWQIEVSGHTDATGPAERNQRLSEGRALSAAQRLIDQGVPSDQVTSVGRGEDEPVAANDTEAGRLSNRRVEFVVTR